MTLTAPAPTIVVGLADEDDAPEIAYTIALAFEHDPVVAWFLPRAEGRLQRARRIFEAIYVRRFALPQGLVHIARGHAGAALWIPPGGWETTTAQDLRMLPALAAAWRRDLPRAMRGIGAMDAVHPHEPHYYLPLVGVRPEWQGRGIGSALLAPVLARCDHEGVPAYLEATTPMNRELYLRHGFADCAELRLPDGGPQLWPMWREPA